MADTAEEKRLYKIGEVCRLADVQPYVLRYWETEFAALAPNKSGGGQRLYTQREIDIILRIKQLLYSEGFTIAGAKKKLEAELSGNEPEPPSSPLAARPAVAPQPKKSDATKKTLGKVKQELSELLRMLEM